MFYFLMQLAAVIAAALALGLLVGWMLWARALRHHRRGHGEQVGVLHRQLSSLADENRRAQQRFVSTAADLDAQRLTVQSRETELRRAREAFTVSQQNLAGAESQLAGARQDSEEVRTRVSLIDADLVSARAELADLHTEVGGLRLDSAEAKALRSRVDELVTQLEQARAEVVSAQQRDDRLQQEVEVLSAAAAKHEKQSRYLGRALDAATARANDRTESDQRQAHLLAEVAKEHDVRVAATVAAVADDARNDVRALVATWEQISARRSLIEADQKREVAALRSRLAAAEDSVASLRNESTAKLEAVRSFATQSVSALADQQRSIERAQAEGHHTSALAAQAVRHDRYVHEQNEAHRLAIEHWKSDLAQRAVQRAAASETDQATIASLQTELEKTTNRLSELSSEFDRVALERHLLDEQVAVHRFDLDRLTTELHAEGEARQLVDSHRIDSADLEQVRAELRAQVSDLASQFDAAVVAFGQLRINHIATTQQHRQSLERSERSDELLRRRLDLAEAEVHRRERVAVDADDTHRRTQREVLDARGEADAWRVELEALRVVHHQEISRLRELRAQTHTLLTAIPEARRLRAESIVDLTEQHLTGTASLVSGESVSAGSADRETNRAAGVVAGVVASVMTEASTTGGDDLQIIEGIGPKIAAALHAAGIGSFVRLEAASPSQLRDALVSSGLTFAPSLPTWSRQAGFVVRGDVGGLSEYHSELTAGRETR